jgi:hypothetical protein
MRGELFVQEFECLKFRQRSGKAALGKRLRARTVAARIIPAARPPDAKQAFHRAQGSRDAKAPAQNGDGLTSFLVS